MAKAIYNGVVIAESEQTERVEGNTYFPPNSIKQEYFYKSNRNTTCLWKGVASYYNIVVDGKEASNAAWYYPQPKLAAKNITGHVDFYPVVKIES